MVLMKKSAILSLMLMKKVLSIIIISCLMLTMFVSASVNSDTKEIITPEEKAYLEEIETKLENNESLDGALTKIFSSKISEYEMYGELRRKTDDELLKLGYDKNTIKQIRNVNFVEKIKERSKYSDKVLKGMGYSEDKIKLLRNFDGTEAQAASLTAELAMTAHTSSYTYYSSSNQTKHLVVANWEWDYCPFFTFTDIIGFSWFDGWHISSTSKNKVYYYHSLGTRTTQTVDKSFTAVETTVAKSTFPIEGTYYGDLDYMYARKGVVYANIYISGNESNSNIMLKYGHRELTGTPTLTWSGGLDFEFNLGTNEVGSCLVQYPEEW